MSLPQPWKARDQRDFIYRAHKFYEMKAGVEYLENIGFRPRPEPRLIQWLYKLGRDYNLLDMDYQQFERIMITGPKKTGDDWPHWIRRNANRELGRWGWEPKLGRFGGYRILRKYIRLPHHEKKDKKENAWWIEKGLVKTRRKANSRYYWDHYLKQYSAKRRRSMERQAIAHEAWDSLEKRSPRWRDADRWAFD
jgi:hypothetical protein